MALILPPVPRVFATAEQSTFYNDLADLNLLTGLSLCLDAADIKSWPGAGAWMDRSATGTHFNRGEGTKRPTFVGTVGSYGSYWETDGDDEFSLAVPNPAWLRGWHRPGRQQTVVAVYRPQGMGSHQEAYIIGTVGSSWVNPGGFVSMGWGGGTAPNRLYRFRLAATNAAGNDGIFFNHTAAGSVVNGTLYMSSASHNFGPASGIEISLVHNGANIFTGNHTVATNTYDVDGAFPAKLMQSGQDSFYLPAGYRLYALAMWARTLNLSQQTAIWNKSRARWGL